MKLLVVESPAKAKTISRYLGKEYRVKASVGHVRDLPKSNKNAVDIEAGFVPRYQIIEGKEEVVEELRRAAEKSEVVLLATDPDREGEAIAWHVVEACGFKNRGVKRVVFHEITAPAITEALKHPRTIDRNLRTAQEARRVLDRLFGYELSELIWKKVRYGLSAGRVQSPALRILVERERDIRAFTPEKFWVIHALFQAPAGETFAALAAESPKSEEEASQIVRLARQSRWRVESVKEAETIRAPRPPFTTSTLQQAASSRLGFSPSQTMRLAQKLYEGGEITYMRTDSQNLSRAALQQIAAWIEKNYGQNYLAARTYKSGAKNIQEAHEAIRPTAIEKVKASGDPRQQKLYQLIWTRTVACQMAPAKTLKTKVEISASPAALPMFLAEGAVVLFDGWLRVDPAAVKEDVVLPRLVTGTPLELKEVNNEGKETEPPKHYSEAGLIKELEKRGIGRPSTYAPIIQTLLDRGYAERQKRSLRPTEIGEVVDDFLEKHFPDYISDDFTSELENDLDAIAAGKKEYRQVLDSFYRPFKKAVETKKKMPKITTLGDAPETMTCPECGGPMVIKIGRSGKFLSCGKFPKCQGARTLAGEPSGGTTDLAEAKTCPECGEGKLVTKRSRFGKFLACNRYPKCRHIEKDEKDAEQNDTGIKCPRCHQGILLRRRSRFGGFFGCSTYPQCDFTTRNLPDGGAGLPG